MLYLFWIGWAAYTLLGFIFIGPVEGLALGLFPGLILLRHTVMVHRIALTDRQYRQLRTAQNLNRPPRL